MLHVLNYIKAQPSIRAALGVITLVGTVTACAGPIAPDAKPVSPQDLLWKMRVSPQGITMAVQQTLTLRVELLNILGEPMTIPDSLAIEYSSADPSRVTVTSDGTIRGIMATTVAPGIGQVAPVRVTVRITHGAVVRADSVYVAVTNTAPADPPATLSIRPAAYPLDSTWAGTVSTRILPVTVLTALGDTIPNAYAYLYTDQRVKGLQETIMPQQRLIIFRRNPGRFWIFASAWVYGVEFRDSTEYIETDPAAGSLYLTARPNNPNSVVLQQYKDNTSYIAPCGRYTVQNEMAFPVDFILDDPNATGICESGDVAGNVIALPPHGIAERRFKTPGPVRWTVVRTDGTPFTRPVNGIVHVRAHTEF